MGLLRCQVDSVRMRSVRGADVESLGIISAPVVFLDVGEGAESFWQPMMGFLDGAVSAGLLKERYRAFVTLTSSVGEAVRIATGPAPTAAPKWSDVAKSRE